MNELEVGTGKEAEIKGRMVLGREPDINGEISKESTKGAGKLRVKGKEPRSPKFMPPLSQVGKSDKGAKTKAMELVDGYPTSPHWFSTSGLCMNN